MHTITPPPINRESYTAAVNTVQLAAGVLNQIDLDGALGAISRAEAVGPILDPTLYHAAQGKLGDVRRLLECAKPLRDEIQRQLRVATGG